MQLKAVLCDIDGTLIDSNAAHAESWFKTLEHFGIHVPYDDVFRRIGKGGDHLLPELVPKHDLEKLETRIKEHRKKLFHRDYMNTLKPIPKSRELLQRMQAGGLRIAVASSTDKEDLPKLKQIAGIEDLIEKETTSDDTKHSKPDPDIFQAAMGKLGLRSGEVLAFGDTPWDIEAAKKAGVATVAVLSGGWRREELSGAIAIYDDCAHVLREFDSSPFVAAR